jgi:hypothetical protein
VGAVVADTVVLSTAGGGAGGAAVRRMSGASTVYPAGALRTGRRPASGNHRQRLGGRIAGGRHGGGEISVIGSGVVLSAAGQAVRLHRTLGRAAQQTRDELKGLERMTTVVVDATAVRRRFDGAPWLCRALVCCLQPTSAQTVERGLNLAARAGGAGCKRPAHWCFSGADGRNLVQRYGVYYSLCLGFTRISGHQTGPDSQTSHVWRGIFISTSAAHYGAVPAGLGSSFWMICGATKPPGWMPTGCAGSIAALAAGHPPRRPGADLAPPSPTTSSATPGAQCQQSDPVVHQTLAAAVEPTIDNRRAGQIPAAVQRLQPAARCASARSPGWAGAQQCRSTTTQTKRFADQLKP